MKSSLRKQRDRHLEEPYRSWIDGAISLPADVIFLPRKIHVQREAMLSIATILGCLTMAFLFLPGPLKSINSDPSTDSFLTIVVIGGFVVLLPFFAIWRLNTTIGAHWEQKRGKLRQGIIVGPAGVLVRLSPNKCIAIPLERFLRAKTWSGSGESNEEYICIETKDGNIDFSDRSLSVDADAINRSVFETRVKR